MAQPLVMEGIRDKAFVVTGGAGFVGAALCLELLRQGASKVTALDVATSSPWLSELQARGVVSVTGDVRRKEDLEKAMKGASCVFHVASFGRTGKEMLQARRMEEVNEDGTRVVLDSCIEHGVPRLVYTSTSNVVFGGKEIRDGEESLPYFSADDFGRTKAAAEQLVRRANNTALRTSKGVLRTCVIRPAALYGPGEGHHIPRLLKYAKWGLLKFRVGGTDVQTDWVYLDNLVHAHLLASRALLEAVDSNAPPCGQVYFISDGAPVNTFEFLRPLVEGLGYKYPDRELSVNTAMRMGSFTFGLYKVLNSVLGLSWLPEPFILPADVHEAGVTHFFSNSRAERDLQYVPIVGKEVGMTRTLAFWKRRTVQTVESPPASIWISIVASVIWLSLSGFLSAETLGPLQPVQSAALTVFRSYEAMQLTVLMSLLLHSVQAAYAFTVARRIEPENQVPWFLQTLILGYPSLKLLMARDKSHSH